MTLDDRTPSPSTGIDDPEPRATTPDARRGPRERLVELGAEVLSAEELVAVLLGTGSTREPVALLAARVLHELGGLDGLERTGPRELLRIRGLGPSKAARLGAALELGRRAATRRIPRGGQLLSSVDVDAALRPRLAASRVEEFLALPLDAKNRPTGELRIALGGRSSCPVDPAEVFRRLLREAASGVIFVHNHPSGEPSPSPEDMALTARLVDAGELLGIRVLDHIIIAAEGYFSFLDSGLMPRPGQ
ncbi:MAG: DNA repair protein RadC [Polyangiales bacterium]|nr:DNA repair protein RadC [Myxococcales bacterium]MCB9657263.1 DNA repair protein RadC [Sandaracinaceae bacterium]